MVVSGGGVFVAVRNSLDSYVGPDLEADDCVGTALGAHQID